MLSQYPKVKWELDKIYTQVDNIFTSAGVSTGIDLVVSVIVQDCGNPAALKVGEERVVY